MLNMYRRKLCFRFKFFTLLYTYLQTNDSFRDPLPSPPKNVYTALQDHGDILIHVSITIEITDADGSYIHVYLIMACIYRSYRGL